MKRSGFLCLGILLISGWNIDAKIDLGYSVIKRLLDKYKREFTVLEIGIDAAYYAFDIAHEYNATSIMMYLDKLYTEEQYTIKKEHNDNLIILNPRNATYGLLQTVTRCEHFDVVIVHGIVEVLPKNHVLRKRWQSTLDLMLKFGDYTFIHASPQAREVDSYLAEMGGHLVFDGKTKIYRFNTPKKGLDIARWNYQYLPTQGLPRYPIESTFEHKKYYKDFAKAGIPWLKGINLVTFVMLGGIYPTNEIINPQLETMRQSDHNDAIIGNMIVQGTKVRLIDIGDPRWNGNLKKLLNAALAIFPARNISRLKDPVESMEYYRQLVS